MLRFYLLIFFLLSAGLYAGNVLAAPDSKERKLKGYKRLLYGIVTRHPKLNSPFERALLKHYFEGTGETYVVSSADFKRLQQTVPLFTKSDSCIILSGKQRTYCYKQVDLNDDVYFGWGLGTITILYDAAGKNIVSFIDAYDFNKKKIGNRSAKNELFTRLFRLLAPARSKSFLVTFEADAYFVTPG